VPYLAGVLHWWIIALVVLGASAWLVARTFAITKSGTRRVVFTLLSLLMLGSSLLWAKAQTDSAFRSQIWKEYSPALLAEAKAQGKTILLDFTADWCLNCKTLKATVFSSDAMIEAITQPHVVPIEVDLTSTDAEGWALLRQYGQTGIPLLVIEKPGQREPWTSNGYTVANVLEAIGPAPLPAPERTLGSTP
jgi:thiol:disulfide interchange protein DsbD